MALDVKMDFRGILARLKGIPGMFAVVYLPGMEYPLLFC
jgi:hypothetical protein